MSCAIAYHLVCALVFISEDVQRERNTSTILQDHGDTTSTTSKSYMMKVSALSNDGCLVVPRPRRLSKNEVRPIVDKVNATYTSSAMPLYRSLGISVYWNLDPQRQTSLRLPLSPTDQEKNRD